MVKCSNYAVFLVVFWNIFDVFWSVEMLFWGCWLY